MGDLKPIDVVAALIIRDGKVLLSKRTWSSPSFPGKWCCAGGAVEPGETFELALMREIKEEIGVRITVLQKLSTQLTINDLGDLIRLHHFLCSTHGVPLRSDEIIHNEWVTPAEGLTYNLCPLEYLPLLLANVLILKETK